MKIGIVIYSNDPETVWNAFRFGNFAMFACGTYLKIRQSEGSEMCPLSTMKDLYEIVKVSDKIVTF